MNTTNSLYFVFLLPTVCSIPAWWIGRKKKYFVFYEVLIPLVSMVVWFLLYNALITVGISVQKSLSNIAEVFLFLPLLNIATAYLKTFLLQELGYSIRKAFILYALINIIGAVLIFFFTPMLPE